MHPSLYDEKGFGKQKQFQAQLLVAHCTTNLQLAISAIRKLHNAAQCFGCGCARFFPTNN